MDETKTPLETGDRAKWLHELFNGLYFSNRLREAKNSIEYRYDSHLQSLLERRMNDRQVPIDNEEVLLLDNLDSFLNYIEHVLGIERLGLMSREERMVVFDYWPNIIDQNDGLAALRRYIAMCGYEFISEELGLDNIDYLVVYGSLMKGLNPVHQPDFGDRIEYVGEVLIPARLYEVTDPASYSYPGCELWTEPESRILHPGRRSELLEQRRAERMGRASVAELYRVRDATVFEAMDEWEGYNAAEPDASPYIRRLVRMIDPAVDAWIYVGNHADKSQTVDAPNWRDHVKATDEQ